MAGLNRCEFIGNLGRDPEMKYTADGLAIANFNIAITTKWKDEEKTEWVRLVAFGKLAEICGEYLVKGSKIYASGRMQTRDWEDRDGNKRYITEVILDAYNGMIMLSPRNEQSNNDNRPENVPAPNIPAPSDNSSGNDFTFSKPMENQADDDIPF